MITVNEAIMIIVATVVFWEIIRSTIVDAKRKPSKPISIEWRPAQGFNCRCLTRPIDELGYDFAKSEIESGRSTIFHLENEIRYNNNNPYFNIGVMRYLNEQCPVEKFNKASDGLPPEDKTKQTVEH